MDCNSGLFPWQWCTLVRPCRRILAISGWGRLELPRLLPTLWVTYLEAVMWSVMWWVMWSVVWPVVWSVMWLVVWPVMWWLMWACSNISGRQSVILVLKSFCTAIWLHGGGVWGGGYRNLPGNDFQWFMPDNKRVCFILICDSFPDCPISEPSLPERRHTHAQSERHWNEGRVNLNLYCAFFCMLNLLYIH